MSLRPVVAVSAVGLLVLACGPEDRPAEADDTWVGTITTEDNVTTVVNESGSVWGGTATLVEDLSIGVESGVDAYMFGPIAALAATEERIYVADDLRFAIRVYDQDGAHLFDFGRQGEGPGEFDDIRKMAVDPGGRVLVHGGSRVNLFDLDGNVLGSWPYRNSYQQALVVAIDGTAFVPTSWTENEERFSGLIAVAPDGSEGERLTGPVFDGTPWGLSARQGGRVASAAMLYAPTAVWGALPSGAIAEGISDAYRFTVKRPDGSSMIVERVVEPYDVHAEYADWYTIWITDLMRSVQEDWSWTANPVPGHKPAYRSIAGDRYGRIWVQRALGTEPVPDCDADPRSAADRQPIACWRDTVGFGVFDEASGRFLGQVTLPHAPRFPAVPVFMEDAILMVREDEAGTIMVKRYRLVLPGEEEQ